MKPGTLMKFVTPSMLRRDIAALRIQPRGTGYVQDPINRLEHDDTFIVIAKKSSDLQVLTKYGVRWLCLDTWHDCLKDA